MDGSVPVCDLVDDHGDFSPTRGLRWRNRAHDCVTCLQKDSVCDVDRAETKTRDPTVQCMLEVALQSELIVPLQGALSRINTYEA